LHCVGIFEAVGLGHDACFIPPQRLWRGVWSRKVRPVF
jgi:hypothetical protein